MKALVVLLFLIHYCQSEINLTSLINNEADRIRFAIKNQLHLEYNWPGKPYYSFKYDTNKYTEENIKSITEVINSDYRNVNYKIGVSYGKLKELTDDIYKNIEIYKKDSLNIENNCHKPCEICPYWLSRFYGGFFKNECDQLKQKCLDCCPDSNIEHSLLHSLIKLYMLPKTTHEIRVEV